MKLCNAYIIAGLLTVANSLPVLSSDHSVAATRSLTLRGHSGPLPPLSLKRNDEATADADSSLGSEWKRFALKKDAKRDDKKIADADASLGSEWKRTDEKPADADETLGSEWKRDGTETDADETLGSEWKRSEGGEEEVDADATPGSK